MAKRIIPVLVTLLLVSCQTNTVSSYSQTSNEEQINITSTLPEDYKTRKESIKYSTPIEYTYYSSYAQYDKHYSVLLPENFQKEKSYPCILCFPSLSCTHKSFISFVDLDVIYGNLKAENKIQDAIILVINSLMNPGEKYNILNFQYSDQSSHDVHKHVIPQVTQEYNISNYYIYGFSLGGRNGMNYLLEYGKDVKASMLVEPFYFNEKTPVSYSHYSNIIIAQGEYDGVIYDSAKRLSNKLNSWGIKHQFIEKNYVHDPDYAREMYYRFLTTYLGVK